MSKQSFSVQPVLYPFEQHGIDNHLIDKDALYVIQKLQQRGFSAYLVGGGVRDLLSSKHPKDFDISTSAKPEEIKQVFGRQCLLIGRRFRLAHIRFGKKVIEVATFRAGDPADDELILHDNVFGSEEEDALRRDFTINGLFYDPLHRHIIDYVGGVVDLKQHLIRTIGNPESRFKQDPVRMIRLVKFCARFDYNVDPLASQALFKLKTEITKSSQARVLEEILKMMESGSSAKFFKLMSECGLLTSISPALYHLVTGPFHKSIFQYIEAADKIQRRFGISALERPVLFSCLIYPLLEERIKIYFQEKGYAPHLGEIFSIANHLINDITHEGLARLPRRLSTLTCFLLSNQCRLTPLHNPNHIRPRFAQSRDFPMALKLLKIRALVDKELVPIYEKWKSFFNDRDYARKY